MAIENVGSAENMVRIGLLFIMLAIIFLVGSAFGEAAKLFFWMALIVLFFETFKLPSVTGRNAAIAQAILSTTMVIGGIKGLLSSLGKTFTEYHIFLILLIISALLILVGAYKKLAAAVEPS